MFGFDTHAAGSCCMMDCAMLARFALGIGR